MAIITIAGIPEIRFPAFSGEFDERTVAKMDRNEFNSFLSIMKNVDKNLKRIADQLDRLSERTLKISEKLEKDDQKKED